MVIYLHAAVALLAVPLGLYLLFDKKGTSRHKVLGKVWVALMAVVSASAVFIDEINPGGFSPIHIFIPVTVFSILYAIWSIRKFRQTGEGRYRVAHKSAMISVFGGALIIAGIFAFMPGRMLHTALFG